MNKITTVVFSKNRPLQLDLALSSLYLNCEDIESLDINIIYKADDEYVNAYETLKQEHPIAYFIKETNFKANLLHVLYDKTFVLWMVDDTIWTNKFNANGISNLINRYNNVLGFSFRLGLNTKKCYSLNRNQFVPDYIRVCSNIIVYYWPMEEADFQYALEVSQSMYRVDDLREILCNCEYNGPNLLESQMYGNLAKFVNMPGLMCFEKSAAFSNPLNKVQTICYTNRAKNDENYSAKNLLKLYENGLRIDPKKFEGFVTESAHQEVEILGDN